MTLFVKDVVTMEVTGRAAAHVYLAIRTGEDMVGTFEGHTALVGQPLTFDIRNEIDAAAANRLRRLLAPQIN